MNELRPPGSDWSLAVLVSTCDRAHTAGRRNLTPTTFAS